MTLAPRRALAHAPAAAEPVLLAAAGPEAARVRSPEELAPRAEGMAPEGTPTLADASQRVAIEMYTASWCSSCAQAKTWLRQQGIAYQEVDIDAREGARSQLRMLNPRGSIPTFDIEGEVLVGFRPERIASLITTAAERHR